MADRPSDSLRVVRDAIHGQQWAAAFDEAASLGFDGLHEAERLDLLAEAAWWLGRLGECIDAREAAYRRFEDLGEARRAGTAAVWLYEHHAFRGHGAIAGAWLRRARRSLENDRESVGYGALLLREAEAMHGAGQLDDALVRAREVVVLARALPSPDLEAEALQTAGRVLIDQGAIADGLGHMDEAMLSAVEGRLGPYATGKVYCSLISACEELGDHDRAAEWTEATDRWARNHPFAIFPGICRVHRAMVLKRRGELAEAGREAARACEELRHSRPVTSAQAWAEVGDICRRLGELDRAESAFARAQELSGGPCAAVAVLRVAQGRVEVAQSVIAGCLAGAVNPLARAGLLPTAVQVAVAAGDLTTAAGALGELESILRTFDLPEHRAAFVAARGRWELASGDAAAASATLRQALDLWRAQRVPYEEATVSTLLGQALRECGDLAGAAGSFAAASSTFDEIGAHLDASLAQRDGTPSRSSPPAGLTGREVEVLRLVAGGLTNNEIAERLCLSAKTVSRHLSNIFTKIGVTSRVAATTFAFEQDLLDDRSS